MLYRAGRSLRTTRFDVTRPHATACRSRNQSDRLGLVINRPGRDLSTSEALGGESRDRRPVTDGYRISSFRARETGVSRSPTYLVSETGPFIILRNRLLAEVNIQTAVGLHVDTTTYFFRTTTRFLFTVLRLRDRKKCF